MTSAIVLAAGLSTRMGEQNKLLMQWKGKPVLEITVTKLLASNVNEVIVVTGHEAGKAEAAVAHLPVQVVYNALYHQGMTSSIQCGVEKAKGDGYMICLADMLMITGEEYRFLVNHFENALALNPQCICVPRHQGTKGNPVFFSSYYKKAMLQHTEPEGCKSIVQANQLNVYWIDMPTNHILQDMDYPGDYERLENL